MKKNTESKFVMIPKLTKNQVDRKSGWYWRSSKYG
jgi:hypothetical protein